MRWENHGIFFQQKLPAYSSHAQVPVVDASHADYWRIYFSSRNDKNYSLPFFIDVAAGKPEKIIRQSEGPLFNVGETGAFDQHGVMPTEILKKDGRDYLYYIAWNQEGDKPFSNSIGLAIKNREGLWEKHKHAVIKGFEGSFYAGTLGIFSFQDKQQEQQANTLKGFYLACTQWQQQGDFYDPCYQIALACSDDAVHWQQPEKLALTFKSPEEGGIVCARVFEQHDCFHMFYAFRGRKDFRSNPQQSYRMGYAQSLDLEHWNRHDNLMDDFTARLRQSGMGNKGNACDFMQCYPYIIKHNQQLFMFYNGNGFGQTGIAYATLPLSDVPAFIAQEN